MPGSARLALPAPALGRGPTLLPDPAPALAGVTVLAVATAPGASRRIVRRQVRACLLRALTARSGAHHAPPPMLITLAGAPPRLAPPHHASGVSVSHAPGLSLLAIRDQGPIGIDVMHDDDIPRQIDAVARDYLGPHAAAALAATTPGRRPAAFAAAWTSFEARIKCLGLPLREWTPDLGEALATCRAVSVRVPVGWTAAVAIR